MFIVYNISTVFLKHFIMAERQRLQKKRTAEEADLFEDTHHVKQLKIVAETEEKGDEYNKYAQQHLLPTMSFWSSMIKSFSFVLLLAKLNESTVLTNVWRLF